MSPNKKQLKLPLGSQPGHIEASTSATNSPSLEHDLDFELDQFNEDILPLALPYLEDPPASPLLEETESQIPPSNRSAGRDVYIFDGRDRSTSIGGLILTTGITNANLYSMVEIFVIFNGEYVLRNENSITIEKDESPLLPGSYYIDSPGKSLFSAFFP
jgi:hypothetical protein